MKLTITKDQHGSVVLTQENGEQFFCGDHLGDFLYTLPDAAMSKADDKVARLERYCGKVTEIVKRYIAGEQLSDDDTYVERLLAEHQKRVAAGRHEVFAATGKKMPPLTISYGSSGLEIRALLDRSFDCVEFCTDEHKPQSVLVAPWIQFPNAELNDERFRLVMEIARRAMAYDDMVKQIAYMETLVKGWRDADDKRSQEQQQLVERWRAERAAAGKPTDFL